MQKTLLLGLAAALLSGAAASCGDDSGDNLSGGNDGGPETVATIDPEEGGSVDTEGAAVTIPEGALAERTEISITVLDADGLPDADMIASEVYDFGPSGTTFETPVTLELEFDASAMPDGMRAVIAWLDTEQDEWVPLGDSEISGDSVTATTDHFTPFAVIWVAGSQVGGQCEDLGEVDCGGDVVGSWEFTLGCLTLPDDFLADDNGDDPFADCGGATLSAVVDFTGTIAFTDDGTYELHSMQDTQILISVPKACVGDMPCSALSEDEEVVDAGDTCDLTMTQSGMNDEVGTYEIENENTLHTTPDGETSADDPATFCVDGDTLRARIVNSEDGTVVVYQATRQ